MSLRYKGLPLHAGFVSSLLSTLVFLLSVADVAAEVVAIENISLADPSSDAVVAGQTVVVEDGTITHVGAADKFEIPGGAVRVDGTGKYLIPGLSDMHVHLDHAPETYLSLFAVNGVTRVRDMGGDLFAVLELKRRVVEGDIIGPDILAAGPIIENRDWLLRVRPIMVAPLRHRIPVSTPREGELVANLIADLGADFVKVRNSPSPDALLALMTAARGRELDTVGHSPGDLSMADALRSGFRNIEHVPWFSLSWPGEEASEARIQELIDAAIDSHGYFTPTIVSSVSRLYELDELRAALDAGDPRDRYISENHMRRWWDEIEERKGESPGLQWPRMLETSFGFLRLLHEAGVPIMCGTDMTPMFVYPGFSVHDELEMLVEHAGMTPREAILTATLRPAQYLGIEDREGRIAVGQVANLVVLDADPFEQIGNIRKIHAVVVKGKLLRSADLEQLKDWAVENKDAPKPEPDMLVDLTERATQSDDSEARSQLARYRFAEGNYTEALKYLPESGPLTLAARMNLVDSQDENADCNTLHATVDAELRLLAGNPDASMDLLSRIQDVAVRHGCEETQRLYLESIAMLDPADLSAASTRMYHESMVNYELMMGNPDAALGHRKTLLPEGWERNGPILNNLAWWCFEQNVALKRAKGWAESAVALAGSDGDKANAMDTLAEVVNAMGDPAEAAKIMERANQIHPTEYFEEQLKRFRTLAEESDGG